MKIVICGSVAFASKMEALSLELEEMGHQVELPFYVKKIISGNISLEKFLEIKKQKGDTEFRKQAGEDLIKRYFKLISECDAVLVVNIEKNGIKNYIGANTFLEMGFAHVLDKKIFLLNHLPYEKFLKDELLALETVNIDNDLSLIK